jgi:DNA-binding transcriptional LysR family regulator
MEMQQVRYFLAVARTLNFTRAAEECNVTQPSLTRAIKQLEGELGGDLFRRERPQAQLTELGQRMYPLLKQCYDSALGARSLASSIKGGEVAALRLALSHSIDLSFLIPHLMELTGHFDRLELKFFRGASAETTEALKQGHAELALADGIGELWERLDAWPLFTERFTLVANARHRLANTPAVELEELRGERILARAYCEHANELRERLSNVNVEAVDCHEVASDRDLVALLEANMGVAIVPQSLCIPDTLMRAAVRGLELRRTVQLYGVAGRQRSAVGSLMLKMLRASDWKRMVG